MILKNVRILEGNTLVSKDIRIEDTIIKEISDSISEDGLDMHGYYCMPGLTDIHVHFREPGQEKKETILTGSKSAAKGGYTTVFLMPNLNPVPDCLENLALEEEIIKNDAIIECIPYGSVTVGEKSEKVSDIENLKEHTRYFSDDGVGFANMDVLKEALQKIKKYGLFVASHAEDRTLKTAPAGEYVAVNREIGLAKEVGVSYHFCHMSTKESFDYIRKAQQDGYQITCEVTPHHLFLNEDMIKGNPNFKMNPPLRSEENRLETIKALLDGTASVIATDHAPHTKEEKSREYDKCPNGIIGLETAAPLVYTNLIRTGLASFKDMEDWMSNNPRRLTHLPLNEVKVGSKANLCFLDIDHEHEYREEEILSKATNSPFLNMKLYGFNMMTIYEGKIVYKKENL
jgi:dihydroorotase